MGYVLLMPQEQTTLHNFTLCPTSFSGLTRSHSLFSYNTRAQDNELLLYAERSGELSLYIRNSKVLELQGPPHSRMPPPFVCQLDSAVGITTFWVDRIPQRRKGLQKGYMVDTEAKIVLGQEQNSFGISFNVKQSFVGKI